MYIGKIDTGRSYKKIIITFVIISIILISVVFYASISRATITITPIQETLASDFEVRAEKETTPTPSFPQTNTIKGEIISVEDEEERAITDIALKEVEEKAKGKVIIYNKRGESQPLLPRTQLKADSNGLIYRTDTHVTVPANGQVEIGVTCDEKGKQGETEPTHFTIVKIWQAWQDLIYAENKEPITGGVAEKKVATQEEIDKAQDEVADDLYKKAVDQIKAQLNENEVLYEQGLKKEIVSTKASVKPDTQTEEFNIKVKIKVTAVIFDEGELLNLAIAKLKDKIPEEKEYVRYLEDKFQYEVLDYNSDKQTARLKVHLEGIAIPKLSPQIFDKDQLISRSPEEVKSYFQKYPNIQTVEIKLSPFWVRSVPALKDHIEIVVNK